MDRTKKAWLNGILLVATLVINTMGAIGLINGLSQKEISDKYLTLITPAPHTFSIWSIIYSLLIISIIVMIVKKNDPYYQKAIKVDASCCAGVTPKSHSNALDAMKMCQIEIVNN